MEADDTHIVEEMNKTFMGFQIRVQLSTKIENSLCIDCGISSSFQHFLNHNIHNYCDKYIKFKITDHKFLDLSENVPKIVSLLRTLDYEHNGLMIGMISHPS